MSTTDKPIEVKPVTLADSSDLKAITGSDAWIADITTRAARVASTYRPHEIVDDADFKRSTADRASARRELKAIDDDRKDKTRVLKEAIRDFESRTKEATEPLRAIDDGYKAELDAYKDKLVEARLAKMREAWEATDAARSVPFDTLQTRYAVSEGWRQKALSDKKALGFVEAHAKEVKGALATIEALPAELKDDARLSYVKTLDLTGSMATAQRRAKAIAEARAAEEAAKGQATPTQAAPATAPQPASSAPQAQPRGSAPASQAPFRPQPQAPVPGAVPGSWQQPQTARPTYAAQPASQEVAKPYRLDTSPLTHAQLDQVLQALAALGVRATARPLY